MAISASAYELTALRSCQVYTPLPIAKAIVHRLTSPVEHYWLEPSVGRGAFLEALKDRGVCSRRITAIDLDLRPNPHDRLARTIRGVDFISWSQRQVPKYDRIVGNPPYVSLTRVGSSLRQASSELSLPGVPPLSGTGNLWAAFLLASLRILKKSGCLGFVLPAAWEFANYAAPLRDYVFRNFEQVEAHRSVEPLFDDVLEGNVVLLGFGFRKSGGLTRKKIVHMTSAQLVKKVRSGEANEPRRQVRKAPGGCRLGELFDIRIGAVTGDVKFFLLNEDERLTLNLPMRSVKPVLTRSRHLVSAEIRRENWKRLKANGERVWLFLPSEDDANTTSSIRTYLATRSSQPFPYKLSARNPWFRTPIPQNPDAFISGMSNGVPWFVFNRWPALSATNTLYTVYFKKDSALNQRAAWALGMFSPQVQQQLRHVARIYPGGLRKFEPSDLADIILPIPGRIKGARRTYSQCVKLFAAGKKRAATKIAYDFLSNT